MLKSLSILIPAYKDEKTIRDVVAEADKAARKNTTLYEIVVINDSSPDNLTQVLNSLIKEYKNLKVKTHTKNCGYGQTIKELYYAAKYEWFFTVPGDGQIPPLELDKLVMHKDEADMIIGWRVNRRDTEKRLIQSSVYNNMLRFLFGINLHDINSVRLGKTSILKAVHLKMASAFVDAELTVSTIRKGYKVIETPIIHKARKDESGAGGGSLKTILPTIIEVFKYWLIKS